MVTKLNTYTTSGVHEYWIVDQKQETIMIYSFNNFEIDGCITYKRGDTALSFWFSGLSVPPEDLFQNLL